jgi:hypothetical protein
LEDNLKAHKNTSAALKLISVKFTSAALLSVLATACKFGEPNLPKVTIEGSNLEIKLTVTHNSNNQEFYDYYKDKYIYIEGYFAEGGGGGVSIT